MTKHFFTFYVFLISNFANYDIVYFDKSFNNLNCKLIIFYRNLILFYPYDSIGQPPIGSSVYKPLPNEKPPTGDFPYDRPTVGKPFPNERLTIGEFPYHRHPVARPFPNDIKPKWDSPKKVDDGKYDPNWDRPNFVNENNRDQFDKNNGKMNCLSQRSKPLRVFGNTTI